ncbi:MAG: 3-deoxy-D-manno-octulosonic acid transferase [Acidobacteriota bacterium]
MSGSSQEREPDRMASAPVHPHEGLPMHARLWAGLYTVLLEAGQTAVAPLGLAYRLAGRELGNLNRRRGVLPASTLSRLNGRRAIWVHAASAGETAAAFPLVCRLQDALPDHPVLFTVTSPYGLAMARRQMGERVAGIHYAPLDLPRYCRRLLRQVRPLLYLVVENDVWPNMVRMVKEQGGKVIVASGQAGPRTFPREFWRATFRHVDRFLMQTDGDARNIVSRGALPSRVEVMGNLKMEGRVPPLAGGERRCMEEEFGFPAGASILVAGSVQKEDEVPVLEAVARLRQEGIDLRAVVAPRRLDRVAAIEQRCVSLHLASVRRTAGGRAPVVILDSMGELARVYGLARVAYVGGGFTRPGGLHNLAEPLALGVPVLYGPFHGQVTRLAGEVLKEGAGLEIRKKAALAPALGRVLRREKLRGQMAAAAEALMAPHRGASTRYLQAILALLEDSSV